MKSTSWRMCRPEVVWLGLIEVSLSRFEEHNDLALAYAPL
jgi:hypothetical protein